MAQSSSRLTTIHGFTIYPYRPLTAGFRSMLKQLAARGFCDPSCTIIKTKLGEDSGITHEGGRYLHRMNPYTGAIMMIMPMYDMVPPDPPFILAPGPKILLHEYGHHTDRYHSLAGQAISYSFRWFSQFYQVDIRLRENFAWREAPEENRAIQAGSVWAVVAGELWADLFVRWFNGEPSDDPYACNPKSLQYLTERARELTIELAPGCSPAQISKDTFALFELGLRGELPAVSTRRGFLGELTDETVKLLEASLQTLVRDGR